MTRDQRERARRERLRLIAEIQHSTEREHSDAEQRVAADALGVLDHLPLPQPELELSHPA